MPSGLKLKVSGSNTQGSMTPLTRTPTHTHTPKTLKSLIFVFNNVHFIIDWDLPKQFLFQVDSSEN